MSHSFRCGIAPHSPGDQLSLIESPGLHPALERCSMVMTQCIETESLLLYLQGLLGQEYSEEIERHLLECPHCENLVVELKTNNESLGLFGASTEVGFVEDLDSADHSNIRNVEEQAKKIPVTPYLTLQEKTIGNYLLHKPVGKGGMAVVYKAENKKLGKIVAVKILRSGFHGPSIHRIEREIKAHSKLDHSAIVSAIDAGEDGAIQYLVTEFVDGLDLSRIVHSYGKLSVADACEIIRQSALGIGSAHQIGIIHRDIKPSNIMIDVAGQVKVLDFGLVHFQGWSSTNLELTSVGQLLGTLDYMPPEQAEDPTSVDLKSDIYSMGATLFCLLVGRAPFASSIHQSPLEKLRLIANEKPPLISSLRPDIPKELSDLIDQSLSSSPSDRPESTDILADQLAPYCAGHRLDSLISEARKRASNIETESFSNHGNPNVFYLSANSTVSMSNQSDSGWGKRNFWKNVALALSFFVVLFLSITFIIQSNRGQIIVEVPDENVKVEVLSAGKVFQELELKPGTNSIHLFAGNYEIRIKEKPDTYQVNGDSIVLGRGKTVIAKITRRPQAHEGHQGSNRGKVLTVSSSAGDSSILTGNWQKQNGASTSGLKDSGSKGVETGSNRSSASDTFPKGSLSENTVDGKSIKHWLSVLIHEHNTDLVDDAIHAIRDLSDPKNDHLVKAAITKMLVQGRAKINNIATEELFIHRPFSSKQINEIDTAIEKMNPDIGITVLEVKLKLIADQLATDFDDDRFSEVCAKTMKQIDYFLDRSSYDKSNLTSHSNYDVQLQIIIRQLLKPFLNQKKWDIQDDCFQKLTNLFCSRLHTADLFFRSIENHPERHFVFDENFDGLQKENQKPIVLQNIDHLMTAGLAKVHEKNLDLPEKRRSFLYARMRKTLSTSRLVSKDLAETLKQSITLEVSRRHGISKTNGSTAFSKKFLQSIQQIGGFKIVRKPLPDNSFEGEEEEDYESDDGSVIQSKSRHIHRLFSTKSEQDDFLKKNPLLAVIGGNGLDFFSGSDSFRNDHITITGGNWFFEFDGMKSGHYKSFAPMGLQLAQIYSLVCGIHQAQKLPELVKEVIVADLVDIKPFEKVRQADRRILQTVRLERDEDGEFYFQLYDKEQRKIGEPIKATQSMQRQTISSKLGVLYFFLAYEKIEL